MSQPATSTRSRGHRATIALLFALTWGCDGAGRSKPAALDDERETDPGSSLDGCDVRKAGCPCTDEGDTAACGSIKEKIGAYVICSKGVRICAEGVWGECIADRTEKVELSYSAPMQGGFSFAALGAAKSCNNLCDPECVVLEDTPDGLVVPGGLLVEPDGLTLPSGGGGGNCTNVSVTPETATVEVNDISSSGVVTAQPPIINFEATCDGPPIQPIWTLDAYDRAVIDTTGNFRVYAAVAGQVRVTGSTAADADETVVNVKVAVGSLVAQGSVADPGKTLYPYKNTVFPLDLPAPLVQWDGGGITPSQVQVALRFPAGSNDPSFLYTNTFSSEPRQGALNAAGPAWQIPQGVWSAFDRTAAGDATGGEILIRRKSGSTSYTELAIPVKFASEALRGTAYYTQYQRTIQSASGRTACTNQGGCTYPTSASDVYTQGDICPVGIVTHGTGTLTSQIRAIDLASPSGSNTNPFGEVGGCPVCHSMSADGETFVSGNQAWQQPITGGIDRVKLTGGAPILEPKRVAPTYSGLSDDGATQPDGVLLPGSVLDVYNNRERAGENSRGLAYAPLTPDGDIALQGAAFWGNTADTPSANNTQDAALRGLTNKLKPYFFVDTNRPGLGVQFATTQPLPANSFANGIFTGASGKLTVDGYTLSTLGQSVLVKDEASQITNGIYALTSVSPWKLRRRYDANTETDLIAGMDVRVADGNANNNRTFYIQTPANGTITPDSTPLQFAERELSAPLFGDEWLAADYATVAALSPGPITSAGNVLSAGGLGPLTVDGQTLGLGDRVLVKNETSAHLNGLYTLTAEGSGVVGSAIPVRVGTTEPLPSNTRTGNVLTSSELGPLSVDGVSLELGDGVLVNDEADGAHNGIYTLTTLGAAGLGTPLLAEFATLSALPAHTQAMNVLSATAYGALGIDGTALGLNASLLVKDEADQTQNGVYVVSVEGTGSSTVLAGADYATTEALPSSTRTDNVLTAGVLGPLVVDGMSPVVGQSLLIKDEADASSNGVYTLTTLGAVGVGTPLDVQYASTVGLPANTRSSNVLNATKYGALVVDGSALAVGDSLLVKNEATAAHNGIYTLTALGTGIDTQLGNVNYATAAPLPPNTASVGVLEGTDWGKLSIDGVDPVLGDSLLIKDEVSAARNGVYTLSRVGTGGSTLMSAVTYATTGVLPANTNSGGVLTPANFGSLEVDGVSVALSQTVLVKNEVNAANNGVYVLSTLGTGGPNSLASVNFATAGALPAYTKSVDVLTAAASGALTVDGVAVAADASVLVKDETASANNGVYVVTNPGSATAKWVLTRRSDANSSAEVTTGLQVPVVGGATNANKGFHVTTAGPIVLNTTGLSFGASVKWVLTRRTDVDATGELLYGLQFPIASGSTNAGKTFYLSAPDAAITVNATAVNFALSSKWQLTRRSDGDMTGELSFGVQVPIIQGTTNNGKTYYLSSPATGAITIGTTPIAFALSSKWSLTRRSDNDTPGEIVGGQQVTSSAGATNAGKTFYISDPASGTVNINTTALTYSPAVPWQLTRRADADATGELSVGLQVPVIGGSANGGTTFYLSDPASGAISINTTDIHFSPSTRWELTRRDDNDATGDITPGQQVTVSSGVTLAGKTFYVSSPASGQIDVNTTPIGYSEAIAWQLTRHPDADTNAEFTLATQASVSSGDTHAGVIFYVTTPSSGSIDVNTTPVEFSPGSPWQLTRTGDADEPGELTPGLEVTIAGGATHAGKVFYVSSPSSGAIDLGSTAVTFSEGMLPTMMTPQFSPDGTKIVYVNGDADIQGGNPATGWRRGLSLLDFDRETLTVSHKQRLFSSWNAASAGVPIKWPFFESDSRSIVYVETDADEYCSSADSGHAITVNSDLRRACFEASYGSMSPTTRGYWKGKLYAIDSENPVTTRVELSKLNDADDDGGNDDTTDADRAYQPTVLPFSSGGYRWVLFTSPRAWGNQFNQKSSAGTATHFSCAASMLWVSALTDTTAAEEDRSNPAFFLPGQSVASITSVNHYVNERGYLVPSLCKDEGAPCSSDDECCGHDADPKAASCRAPENWDPTSGAPEKVCEAIDGKCQSAGESCQSPADCCNRAACVNFECSAPGAFEAATFTREYVAECPIGYHPDWQLFRFHLTTESDSSLEFKVQSSLTLETLDIAKVVNLGVNTETTVSPEAPEFLDIGGKLAAADVSRHMSNLRISITFHPSSDHAYAPILHDWEQRYTCAPGE